MSSQFKILFVSLLIIFNSNHAMSSADAERERLGKLPQSKEESSEKFCDRTQVPHSIIPVFVDESLCSEDTVAKKLGVFKNSREMDQVFEDAPRMAQIIVNRLKNPHMCETIKDRTVIFFGAPGTGKTTVAQAIAHKMKTEEGWESSFFPCSDFIGGGQRNSGADKLRLTLQEIAAREKPNIVIIDELDQLLKHANSSHHDTDATSKVLWLFLEEQKNRPLFFIGIMNEVDKLPPQLKSRWMHCSIEFTEVVDATKKNKIFRNYFNGNDFQLSHEIDDSFLVNQLAHVKDSTYRGFYGFSCMVKNMCDQPTGNGEKIIIQKIDIEQAVKHYQNMFKKMKFDAVEETDVERQERYHEQQRVDQREQFVTQQLIASTIQARQVMKSQAGDSWQHLSEEDVAEIRGIFTEEQRKFVDAAIVRAKHARDAKLDEVSKRPKDSTCSLQ